MAISVFRFLIFDRKHTCLLDKNYVPDNSSVSLKQESAHERLESMQLITGMCYSLKTMLAKLDTSFNRAVSVEDNAKDGEVRYSILTGEYRLIYFEPSTGWKFVALISPQTDIAKANLLLPKFYQTVFVSAVIRNPLIKYSSSTGNQPDLFDSPTFHQRTAAYFASG